jgi:hypothetical protein
MALPVSRHPVNLYIADKESTLLSGNNGAPEIRAAIPVFPTGVDNLQPLAGAGYQIIF